ncbi:hypothetical protein CYG49_04725 [Candidatus Saccharibacteria bacterium]|nr:MAG: hypothetical protein CYG49_04725 [Candidatus Saccharibacteria bacterium]
MSPYLLAPLLGWALAQTVKYLVFVAKTKNPKDMSFFLQSGNMPSVHTAAVVALIMAIALEQGTDTPVFALSLVFGIIIAYDAMQVRRAAGEQGLAVRQLLEKAGLTLKPYHALGHKPVEVLIGAAIGIIAAIISLSF